MSNGKFHILFFMLSATEHLEILLKLIITSAIISVNRISEYFISEYSIKSLKMNCLKIFNNT